MGLFQSEEATHHLSPVDDPSAKLEDVYKFLQAQIGKTEANILTTQLAAVILRHSVHEGASDVHFDPQGEAIHVRFRVDGELKDRLTFSKKDFPATAVLRVMAGFSPQAATAYTPEDGAFAMGIGRRTVRFRASSFPTLYGDKLVIRLLDMVGSTASLDELGFSPGDLESLKRAISLPNGIFFVCGITGGGKTTTLCSILNYLNRPEINIMTLEDPVEYQLPRVIQSNINPKTGFNFADGLRSILRQDPNIIMVGEVRDLETAEIAMRAALTGHLIFSTIHTISSTGVITRLIDMGIPPFLITDAMIGSLSQRLIKKVCAACAEPAAPDKAAAAALIAHLPSEDAKAITAAIMAPGAEYRKGKGCPACHGTGYKGRTGIFELLIMTKQLRELIARKAPLAELRAAAVGAGMKSLLMDGLAKARAGLTTLDEVRRVGSEI